MKTKKSFSPGVWMALFAVGLALLVFFAGAMPARAAETQKDQVTGTLGGISVDNPLTAGAQTQDVADASDESAAGKTSVRLQAGESHTVSSAQEAAEYVRAQMKNREASSYFTYRSAEKPTQQLFYDIFDLAVAQTEDPSEGDYLRWSYENWNVPNTSYVYADGIYTMSFSIHMTYYTTAAQEQEFVTAAAQLCESLQLRSSSLSDYEKIAAIYDYICANVSYDYTSQDFLKQTAYGALINHSAVCQGYAGLFYWMSMYAGIDCRLVPGISSGVNHGWNMPELDGQYYFVDATWDAGRTQSEYRFFLKGSSDFPDHQYTDETDAAIDLNAYRIAQTAYQPGGSAAANDFAQDAEGNWNYYVNGRRSSATTIVDGTVDGQYAWWYIKDGTAQRSYIGVRNNQNGWWRIENGKVNFYYNGIAQNENGWWKIVNGQVDFGYTGVSNNGNGWWRIESGKVNFGYNGIAQNENGWWKIKNGQVDFGYTGVSNNENGWWRIESGQVNFGYNGIAQNENGWWKIVNGKVDFGYTGVSNNENGWWRIESGQVNFGYNGISQNENGWWYLENGKVDFSKNGLVWYGGKSYRVSGGKVA